MEKKKHQKLGIFNKADSYREHVYMEMEQKLVCYRGSYQRVFVKRCSGSLDVLIILINCMDVKKLNAIKDGELDILIYIFFNFYYFWNY